MNNLFKYSKIGIGLLVVLYFLLTVYYSLSFHPGKGDELLFLTDLNYINDFGWIEAIKKGISIPYMVLAYPLTYIFENHIALRIVNILLLGLLLFYFKFRNVKSEFYLLFFFFLTTGGRFFMGTNDSIFFIGLIVFFYEVYQLTLGKKWYSNLAFLGFLVAFFSRELILVYVPLLVISFYFIAKQGKVKSKNLIGSFLFCLVMLLFNFPSILENKKLSYDVKSPPKSIEANWVQRQYLAQLMVNKGELKDQSHPTWEQTVTYLNTNGENSLPKTLVESIFFDFELTVKEFFKDFIFCITYGFRQLGLVFLFPFFMVVYLIYKKEFTINAFYFPTLFISIIAIFSFIIISYVELRWMVPIFIIAIVYFLEEIQNLTYGKYIQQANYCFVLLLSLYGITNLIGKI